MPVPPTQMSLARQGVVSKAMAHVAEREGLDGETVRDEVAQGRLIIPANVHHRGLEPMAIGRGARVKVNANIVDSSVRESLATLRLAVRWGADAVMNHCAGIGDVIEASTVPVGTVPIYQAVESVPRVEDLTADILLATIERQATRGVDYMTVHAGIRRQHLPLCEQRVLGIVSRGGGALARWMVHHRRENPLFERFDDVLDICRAHDVSLSLGDGLRPGCIADASDAAQFAELDTLGELTQRAWAQDVQVMVEGPGHLPIDQLEMNVRRQQAVCHDAPYYTRGPLVTDVALGYDHITSAIGAAIAGWHGTSMLCSVSPSERLRAADAGDVKQGLIAYRIAAHAADLARGCERAATWDRELSKARSAADWQRQFNLAVDPHTARALYDESPAHDS